MTPRFEEIQKRRQKQSHDGGWRGRRGGNEGEEERGGYNLMS